MKIILGNHLRCICFVFSLFRIHMFIHWRFRVVQWTINVKFNRNAIKKRNKKSIFIPIKILFLKILLIYFSLSWVLVKVTLGPSLFTLKPVTFGKPLLCFRLSLSCFISCVRNDDKSFKTILFLERKIEYKKNFSSHIETF